MHVEDVDPFLAANSPDCNNTTQDVSQGEQFQNRVLFELVGSAFCMREHLPTSRCVSESANLDTIDLMILQAVIGWSDHCDLMASRS